MWGFLSYPLTSLSTPEQEPKNPRLKLLPQLVNSTIRKVK